MAKSEDRPQENEALKPLGDNANRDRGQPVRRAVPGATADGGPRAVKRGAHKHDKAPREKQGDDKNEMKPPAAPEAYGPGGSGEFEEGQSNQMGRGAD